MAQRTVCIYRGKYIGIESIYTVINGLQINIPEKLEDLRTKSKNNELFCPCGCGSNLILVAGDKNLREQHFRLKDGIFKDACNVIIEGKTSINSKIVLKCWLDDKLKSLDIETRVPIQAVDDSTRKYEFTLLSQEKKIAISYCCERENLSDEKLDILESNGQGIDVIYIVDIANSGCNGQYPEGLIKVQRKQGYCLFLEIQDVDYSKAILSAVFYIKDIDGLWQEVSFAEGKIKDFSINENGRITYLGQQLDELKVREESMFLRKCEAEKLRRLEEERKCKEQYKRKLEEEERRKEALKREIEKAQEMHSNQATELTKKSEETLKRNKSADFSQQEIQVMDSKGNRLIKCEFCERIATVDKFSSYGGPNHVNLGTCKECAAHNPAVKQKIEEKAAKEAKTVKAYASDVCPECGGRLQEKNGQYGKFIGCSQFPVCRYTRRIKKIW